MGKTPDAHVPQWKGRRAPLYHTKQQTTMRYYRRKTPEPGSPNQEPHENEAVINRKYGRYAKMTLEHSPSVVDNQLEHDDRHHCTLEQPEIEDRNGGTAAFVSTEKVNAYQRKKKWKPHEREHTTTETKDRSATTAEKRKPRHPELTQPPLPTDDGKARAKPKSDHRRKKAHTHRKDRPSLLKQLLWKAKTTTSPEPSPLASQTPSISTVDEAAITNAAEDEEVSYTVNKRHALKLQASLPVKELHSPVESSSQETQSGTDDEQFGCLQYSMVSSTEHRASEQLFPVPFPIEELGHVTAFAVHEIVLEDFTFHPQELHVQRGDVIVWRVSEQTLGMVEHCLEVTFIGLDGAQVSASSGLIGPGQVIAWRFDSEGRVMVECAVYQTHCAITIGSEHHEPITSTPSSMSGHVASDTPVSHGLVSVHQLPELMDDDDSDDVAIFHPPRDLSKAAEVDAGVCREVLVQLEEVKSAATPSYILVGDILCPVDDETTPTEPVENEALAVDTDEIEDFEQKIIGMLKKSEETQWRQRKSFVHEHSPFDAEAAYDFFKQRFVRLQQDNRAIVYSICPELKQGDGVSAGQVAGLLVA